MGAWGVKVLQNDYALDALYKVDALTTGVYDFAKSLLTNEHNYKAGHLNLLGIAIVDASINGLDYTLFSSKDTMYGYSWWFKSLEIYPLLDLVPLAREAIVKCIEAGVSEWAKDCQEDRMRIYETYRDRLNRISTDKEKISS